MLDSICFAVIDRWIGGNVIAKIVKWIDSCSVNSINIRLAFVGDLSDAKVISMFCDVFTIFDIFYDNFNNYSFSKLSKNYTSPRCKTYPR